MSGYIIHRLLYIFPTLLAISLLAFALSKAAPGDPVTLLLNRTGEESLGNAARYKRSYVETAHILGLDKPAFYFSLLPQAYPDTLYRIIEPVQRGTIKQLCARYGQPSLVHSYYNAIQAYSDMVWSNTQKDSVVSKTRTFLSDLLVTSDPSRIRQLLAELGKARITNFREYERLKTAFLKLEQHARPAQKYIPGFQWYGLDNQYHHWLSGVLTGDFGKSWRDGQPVGEKINTALRLTLLVNIMALIFSFGLSIPLGVMMAKRPNGWFDKGSKLVLFFFYALPSFWVATLLLIGFTRPGSSWVQVLQPSMESYQSGSFEILIEYGQRLLLPVFCLTYGSLAYITLQVRSAMEVTLQQDYIRTARAKGLSERRIIWKHAGKNAAFPLITLIGTIFPALLAGSVVIESVFNLPGMGKLTLDAITGQDWPVVYAVLWITAVLTMLGLLLSDLMYAWLDPRVRAIKNT